MATSTPDALGTRELLRGIPRPALLGLGALTVLRAVALVVLADGVATGVAQLAAGRTDGITAVSSPPPAAGLVRALTGWASAVATARAAAEAKRRQRRMLIAAVADGRATGRDTAALATTGLDALDEFWLATVPAAVGAVAVPLVLGLRILTVDWPSALIVALTLPLVPVFMVLIGQHTRERTADAQAALARLADYLVDLAAGLPVLVGLGRAGEQRRALAEVQRRATERTRGTLRTALLSALALELIATISVALVAVVLGLRLLTGTVELRDALVVLVLAPDCFAALREVGAAFHSSQRGLDALARVRAVLGRARPPRPVPGSELRLDAVMVHYPDGASVGPLSLRVPVGGSLALAGPSGAGKSTAVAALTGTLASDAAAMRGAASAPARIAVARQEPRFMARTVRAELALFGPADAGAALAGRLGLGTVLDADPAALSLGERRRLALARALLRVDAGATALILDEPTAHLDAASSARVLAELDARSPRTAILVVSHDPTVAEWADRTQRMPDPRVPDPRVPDPRAPDPRALDARALEPRLAVEESGGSAASAVDPDPAPEPAADPAVDPAPEPAAAPAAPPAATSSRTGARAESRDEPRGSAPGLRAAALLLAVFAAGSALALTGLSGWLIVRAAQEPAIMYLTVAIVGVRFFGIARAALRYVERLVEHDAVLRWTDALRLRLWTAIAARGAGSRRLLEGGEATDVLVVRLERIRELWPRVLPSAVAGVASATGVVVTTGLLVPAALPTVAVVLVGGLILGSAVARWTTRSAAQVTEAARAELTRELGAQGGAAVDLRLNGVAQAGAAAPCAATDAAARAETRVAWGSGLASAIVVLAGSSVAASAPLSAGASAAELVAVVALLGLAVVDPLVAAVGAVPRAVALRESMRALRPLLRPASGPEGEGRLDERLDRIELVGVGIRWPGAREDAVHGATAVLDRGAWTVLDGPSGTGKSTVLAALMGVVAPRAGRIEYDGVPGALLSAEAIRSHVAWCPQDAHVFDSTLRGNLRIARPHGDAPDDEELLAALRRVGLHHLAPDVRALDRRIGSGGERISGGERQRLAVARALLSRAEVMLLDEPTAHLDDTTADAMMADLRAALTDRIVVLVSHRTADRRDGDRIVRLGHGAAVPDLPRAAVAASAAVSQR